MPGRGRARLAPLVLVVATGLSGTLSGCGADDEPPDATASPRTEGDSLVVPVARDDDTFSPNGERVDVAVGQTLVLEVTADEAGELHVHSTPEQEIAYETGTSEHEITIDTPGVVEVESHDPDSIVLQLEVR